MADEPTPSTQGTEAPTSEAPTDFREYAAWRATGELPQKEVEPATPAAAEPEAPPATTAPDSEPDEDQEQDTAENAKPGSRRSRKIERLVRENAELAMRIAQLAQKPAAEEPKQAAPQAAPGKPKLEDFQTLEEFQEALTDFKIDQREKAKAEAEAKRARETADREAFETWAKREKAAKRAHDDYEDVLDTVAIPDGPGVQAARQAMLESDSGAEILYHLAKHPAELKRIAALSPVSAVREVGKLEAALTKPSPENGTPKITGAPKPPPPTGRPSKTTTDDLTDPEVIRDYSKWEKLRMAQLRSK